jgi:hypothetical protein
VIGHALDGRAGERLSGRMGFVGGRATSSIFLNEPPKR